MNSIIRYAWIITLHILVVVFLALIVQKLILPYILSTIWAFFLTIVTPLCLIPFFVIQSFYSYFIYITAIICALFTIIASNPIYSLLSLITVFFHILLFLLALKIEFLSLIFLIIYVGAIAILFLFVIMMFNLKQLNWNYNSLNQTNIKIINIIFLSSYILLKIFFIIEKQLTIFVLNQIVNSNVGIMKTLNIQEIVNHKIQDILFFSEVLYTYYAFIFILSGFVLLTAMIGAIVCALKKI